MVVVVPFTRDQTRPKLVDRQVRPVKIGPFFTKILAATMAAIVISPNSDGPKGRSAKDGAYQGHTADEIKNRKPESPVEKKVQDRPERMANGSPFQVLRIVVDPNPCMPESGGGAGIFLWGKIPGDGLVVHVRQEAIKPPAIYVIRVARLFGNVVMHMVGNDINFLRNELDHQLPDDKQPNLVFKRKSVVGGVAVQVNGSMRAQNDHAVNK